MLSGALVIVLSIWVLACGNSATERSRLIDQNAQLDERERPKSLSEILQTYEREGNFLCPVEQNFNIVPPPGDARWIRRMAGFFRGCVNITDNETIRIHGETAHGASICAFPTITDSTTGSIQTKQDPTTNSLVYSCQSAQPNSNEGVDFTFANNTQMMPNGEFNSILIVEEVFLPLMIQCIQSQNLLACPEYSFGEILRNTNSGN